MASAKRAPLPRVGGASCGVFVATIGTISHKPRQYGEKLLGRTIHIKSLGAIPSELPELDGSITFLLR